VPAAVAIVVAVAASCLLRLPAFDMPLNRDEAAYALIGDQGSLHLLPYRDFFDHKQPLVYLVYWALALVAPLKVGAVRLMAALVAGLFAALFLLVLRRFCGTWRALAAAVAALVAGATTYVEGYDLNTEHLLVATGSATVLLALLLERSRNRRVPLVVGLLGGVAVITKAVFITMAPAALIPLVAYRHLRDQSVAATVARFGLGLVVVPAATFALFAALGAAGDFVAANITYNRAYAAAAPDRWNLPADLLPLWILFGVALFLGGVRLVALRGRDVVGWTLLAWLVGSLVGAKLGGYDYPHYFAPCIPPAVALLWLPWPHVPRTATVALVAVAAAALFPFVRQAGRAFGDDGPELSARQYGPSLATLWNLEYDVGRRLHALARPGDRMFVAGSEPGFYWTSGIRPATRYPYDYPRAFRADWLPDYRGNVCRRPPRFLVAPLVDLPEPCLDPTRYRALLDRAIPGGRVRVLMLAG
jgi:4-amino-4-deoxy-L-arabinose transferase-like glycosyltransferase